MKKRLAIEAMPACRFVIVQARAVFTRLSSRHWSPIFKTAKSIWLLIPTSLFLGLLCRSAFAQAAISAPASTEAENVVVIGRENDLVGYATTSSEGVIGADQLTDRPISRRGEVLGAIPGVIITQHSGEGKANQYSCAVSTLITAPISRFR